MTDTPDPDDALCDQTRELLIVLTRSLSTEFKTNGQYFALCRAYMCEGERIMRVLFGDMAVAEMYYRCADAASLKLAKPPKEPA